MRKILYLLLGLVLVLTLFMYIYSTSLSLPFNHVPYQDIYKIESIRKFADVIKIKDGELDWGGISYDSRNIDYLKINIQGEKYISVDAWGNKIYIENRYLKDKSVLIISPGKNNRMELDHSYGYNSDRFIDQLKEKRLSIIDDDIVALVKFDGEKKDISFYVNLDKYKKLFNYI